MTRSGSLPKEYAVWRFLVEIWAASFLLLSPFILTGLIVWLVVTR